MPFFSVALPFYKRVDLGDSFGFVDMAHVYGALEEGVHVQFPTFRTMTEELEDSFEPAHEGCEEAVIVDVNLVDELVEVVLVAGAEVDKGLDCLVRVRRDVLALGGCEDGEGVVCEGGEVGDGIVYIGGFVDADEGFVEDGEEVAEEVEGYGFFYDGLHLGFVSLTGVHFEELFEVSEEFGALLHFVVNLFLLVQIPNGRVAFLGFTFSTALFHAT